MPGQVAFNNTPGDLRTPLFYGEVNPGIAPYSGKSRTLLIGRKLASSTALPGKLINIGSSDPNGLFGPGSMLTDMAVYARNFNSTGEMWALPLADPGGGSAATSSFTITGTATSPGTLTRFVGGERYDAAVATGDTPTTMAAALAAKINAGYYRYNRRMLSTVTATAVAGVVTCTANHTGTESSSILLEANLDGDAVDPAGVSVAIAQMSGGAGTVDLAAALALLASQPFDWVGAPYNSVTQLNAARDFFSDVGYGRWSPLVGLDGHYITSNEGNLSAQTSFGTLRNDRHATLLGVNGYSSPSWCFIGALTGVVGFSKNLGRSLTEAIEIARPLQTIELNGLRGPADPTKQWGLADRESLYRNGISALTFQPDGTPTIDRVLTTWQRGPYGVADITFLGIEPIAISAYVKRYMKQVISVTYPRHVLRDDNPNGLQGVATIDAIRSTLIHAYSKLCDEAGVVENKALFAKYIIVERSANPDRVNCYLPTDVANQLVVVASNITIFPQFDDATVSLL